MTSLFHFHPPQTPLLIDVPHAGTGLPEALARRMTREARRLADTDWHVGRLYEFALAKGAGRMEATQSRYVADLNRDPSGKQLYPGCDNTELVPARTFALEAIYEEGQEPDAAELERRQALYWRPYHERLAAEIEAVRTRFGYCVLLDAHSIPARVPRFFEGSLPVLNLGTADGQSCAASLADAAWNVLDGQNRWSRVLDGRFKGGYITRAYGRPEKGVHALQLEIVQDAYMDEANPLPFRLERAADLIALLGKLVDALLAWRPNLLP
jgi:N-formylglutamate deformylase